MPRKGWKTVSIPEKMEEEIRSLVEGRPDLGFSSLSSFVTEAVRESLKKYQPRFKHCNVYENHATIMDNELDTLVDVWFRGDKPFCDWCDSEDCVHVEFALTLPKVVKALEEKGWVIGEGKVLRAPQ